MPAAEQQKRDFMKRLLIVNIGKIKSIAMFIALYVFTNSLVLANDVKHSQILLLELGFNPGPTDGKFGKNTKLAIEQFYIANADSFDGKLSANELMDLSIAANNIFPDCIADSSIQRMSKQPFFENLMSRTEEAWNNSKFFPNYPDTRYGPFLYWIYENTSSFLLKYQPRSLSKHQSKKLNILLNRLCFVKRTKTGQRGYVLALIDFLNSIRNLGDYINEGHALLWKDFPYIDTGHKVIAAPKIKDLEYYKKYTSTSGIMIVGGEDISDEAMLAARIMVEYQLSERPDLHALIQTNKLRVSLFSNNSCELPEFTTYCDEGGFAMSETDATMPVNASWLCYPGNKNIGGNPLFHEMAHSLQHIIFESTNDQYFYQTLPNLIDQAYERQLVEQDFPAGEVWAVAVEGYMMDGGVAYKASYSSRLMIKNKHPEMFDLITKYFPTAPTIYCQF